jgi:hypothetical protein
MAEKGLGEGIKFPDYKLALAKHKATDMKHDKLTLGTGGTFWQHYYKFIPQSVNALVEREEGEVGFFSKLNDNKFMENYIYGDLTVAGDADRPIKSMLDLIFYCTGISDISKFKNDFGKENDGLANGGVPKRIYVKIGEGIVYTYFAKLQNLNYSIRDDAKTRERIVPAKKMLENLDIVNGSLLNVDFQYHLWDLLKSGDAANYDPAYKIYLLMNPENINDPAGKFNMNDSIFKKKSGVGVILAKCTTSENTIYSAYDKREDEYPGPDFFSRFDVVVSEIKTISNLCGLIKSLGVELTIKSSADNFMYSGISKANNSNAVVRGELEKLHTKYNSLASTKKSERGDLELKMAAEAAKKGGGDDLQLLSHWHIFNRLYECTDPTETPKRVSNDIMFKKKENPVFFVSHDGPTIVRSLIEGNNVLFMYSQLINGSGKDNKYECAISLINGVFEQPPEYISLQVRYEKMTHNFLHIESAIVEMNRKRKKVIEEKKAEFDRMCNHNFEYKPNVQSNQTTITTLLQLAVELCMLRDTLCNVASLFEGIEKHIQIFFDKAEDYRKEFDDIITQLSEASGVNVLKDATSILNTLSEKNRAVLEEESKYVTGENRVKKITTAKIEKSPAYISCTLWSQNRSKRLSSDTGIIDDKMTFDVYFECLAKCFTSDESRKFIEALTKAKDIFGDRPTQYSSFEKYQQVLSFAIARLVVVDDQNIMRINIADAESMNKIADDQFVFYKESDTHNDLSTEEETFEGGKKQLGGSRIAARTTLYSTNDRGLPYCPILSRVSYNYRQSIQNELLFTDATIYSHHNDEMPDIPIEEFQRMNHRGMETDFPVVVRNIASNRTNVPFYLEGMNGGEGQSNKIAFEDLLILGKLFETSSIEEKQEYMESFRSYFSKSEANEFRKWINFEFPNPMSSFHGLFFMMELFFEELERKLKDSAYLPELLAYFFTCKRIADEMILQFTGITKRNAVERLKKIRVIGSVCNLLFYVFPQMDEGNEMISRLLSTEYPSIITRITSNLVFQYVGNIYFNKDNIKSIKQNINKLLESEYYNEFLHKIGVKYFDKTVNLFRNYDNSILLIFAGSVDLSEIYSVEDMNTKLHGFNLLYKSKNAILMKLKPPENFLQIVDSKFKNFVSKVKTYTKTLLRWNIRDVLNRPVDLLQSITPKKSLKMKTMKRSQKSSSVRESSRKRKTLHRPTIEVYGGGRKTRRKRK